MVLPGRVFGPGALGLADGIDDIPGFPVAHVLFDVDV